MWVPITHDGEEMRGIEAAFAKLFWPLVCKYISAWVLARSGTKYFFDSLSYNTLPLTLDLPVTSTLGSPRSTNPGHAWGGGKPDFRHGFNTAIAK